MDTGTSNNIPKNAAGSRGASGSKVASSVQQSYTPAPENNVEDSVFSKVQGAPMTKSYLEVVKKKPIETLGGAVLEKFDVVVSQAHILPQTIADKNKHWCPVVATRASTSNLKDPRPTMQKAQDLKRIRNLEVPNKGKNSFHNSFACLDDDVLISTAECSGINLSSRGCNISNNIVVIKNFDLKRMDKFNQDNPEIFLPANIYVSREEFNLFSSNPETQSETGAGPHMNVDSELDSPWIEVKYAKSSSSRRKLDFIIK